MHESHDHVPEVSGSGRRRLLTAAGRLFARSGLSEVTVAQILEHSGVKAPTLYHHFGGKEGLYVSWACNTLDVSAAEFKALKSTGPTLREFLLEAARILHSSRSLDVLQVLRDRRWLADQDSREMIDDALKTSVFGPICRAIESSTQVMDAMDASQAFVHLISVRRSCYLRPDSSDPMSAEELVDVFLSGIHASTRSGVPLEEGRSRLPGQPAELK